MFIYFEFSSWIYKPIYLGAQFEKNQLEWSNANKIPHA